MKGNVPWQQPEFEECFLSCYLIEVTNNKVVESFRLYF